jgi:LacI family transcriptional regulator
MCRDIKRLRLPTVITDPTFMSIANSCKTLRASRIATDHEAIVRMACDYLLQNNFQHLAFCGIPGGWWSKNREDVFVQYLNEQSVVPHVYPCSYRPPKEHLWERDSPHLAKWLHHLPKPIAILACNDNRGRHLLQVCNAEGIDVPGSVSVLGIDDDDLECELTQPTLSSIALNVTQVGYEAMRILMATIADSNTPSQMIHNLPTHITERHSVNVATSGDELVSKALQYIRQNFLLSIQVADVVRFVGGTRRSLERRFACQLNKTILQQIQAMKLERAKQLLVHTEDSVNKVAMASGFDYLQPMLQLFREQLQCTPKEYRETNKLLTPFLLSRNTQKDE